MQGLFIDLSILIAYAHPCTCIPRTPGQAETPVSERTISGRDDQSQDPPPVIQADDFNIQVGLTGFQYALDTLSDGPHILDDDCDFSWVIEAAPTWQPTDLDIGVGHVGEPLQDPFNLLERTGMSDSRHELTSISSPRLLHINNANRILVSIHLSSSLHVRFRVEQQSLICSKLMG